MSAPPIESVTVQIYRLTPSMDENGVLSKDESYIRITGDVAPAEKPRMPLTQMDFADALGGLRYEGYGKEEVEAALGKLSDAAQELLVQREEDRVRQVKSEFEVPADRALQIDLVLGSAELWAIPFEAYRLQGRPVFADEGKPVILTRRVRRGFVAHRRPWPVTPRVLFAHAQEAGDLSEDLIEHHRTALSDALAPWSSRPEEDGILRTECVLTARDLGRVLQKATEPFTHVHLLAHGKAIFVKKLRTMVWGVRLGDEGASAVSPAELKEAFACEEAPVVVTLCVCDGANQEQSGFGQLSIAQELHESGVPVVLASQLPLTKSGSVTLAKSFYGELMAGGDVRWALHQARLALAPSESAGHDWVSLVGYVQLPEGYADHLYQADMARLRAARKDLDRALREQAKKPSPETARTVLSVEASLLRCIETLEGRLQQIPESRRALRSECQGVLASAHKRMAEFLFRTRTGRRATAIADEQDHLQRSLTHYEEAYANDMSSHWVGVQQLSLETVLSKLAPADTSWAAVFQAAEAALEKNAQDYWAHGTVAELHLLASLKDGSASLRSAEGALQALVTAAATCKAAGDEDAQYAAPATRDQLQRYVDWWTKDEYFTGFETDLAKAARTLIAMLG